MTGADLPRRVERTEEDLMAVADTVLDIREITPKALSESKPGSAPSIKASAPSGPSTDYSTGSRTGSPVSITAWPRSSDASQPRRTNSIAPMATIHVRDPQDAASPTPRRGPPQSS